MKKLLAMLTALAMMLSLSLVAFADDETQPEKAEAIENLVIQKSYLETDGDTPDTFPAETLQFTVTADESNPDGTPLSAGNLLVESNPDSIVIPMPQFTTPGTYTYYLQEIAGNTQGVTYNTEVFTIRVQVVQDGEQAVPAVAYLVNENDEKVDTIVNRYDLGELDVEKEVTGNMGDRDREFLVDVTFTAEEGKQILSAITYEDDEDNVKVITPEALAGGSVTVTISLKHDEEVEFDDIPAGVTYKVQEHDYTGADGYDVPVYEMDDDKTIASRDGVTGKIMDDDEEDLDDQDVDIINNKGTVVETGVFMDSAPYLILLTAVAVGAILLMGRKRRMA